MGSSGSEKKGPQPLPEIFPQRNSGGRQTSRSSYISTEQTGMPHLLSPIDATDFDPDLVLYIKGKSSCFHA